MSTVCCAVDRTADCTRQCMHRWFISFYVQYTTRARRFYVALIATVRFIGGRFVTRALWCLPTLTLCVPEGNAVVCPEGTGALLGLPTFHCVRRWSRSLCQCTARCTSNVTYSSCFNSRLQNQMPSTRNQNRISVLGSHLGFVWTLGHIWTPQKKVSGGP